MKKHILLIDDDKDEVLIFTEALKQFAGSYTCTYASSAKQALEMLRYLTPDFIIGDFNMPVLNGLQLLTEVKKIDHLKNTPFFLYSTMKNDEMADKAKNLGAAGWVRKQDSIAGAVKAWQRTIGDTVEA